MLNAFVTVGSTKFDALIHQILSQPVLEALASKGYKTLVVQCGNSQLPNEDETEYTSHGVSINLWRFKTSLQEEYEKADLVISHAGQLHCACCCNWGLICIAGSGTILNVLRMRKPLIVVPNTTLLDDHQQELAEALSVLGHLVAADIS